ncbi:ABC transporter ATP-binding protein [Anaerorhabdus sp.]|uniref:ABC transporter ATP-binding protein n=1 Tax=Anaerorhabdus sp. TaxID=1872524 RepID=UPI002B202AAF|nr:ABC transporter ATP-binding protein [Anaerorhabdus sp.]MEA4875370.1 ABC transporter ATP-binding protein [Anaerorhabdus sp.]
MLRVFKELGRFKIGIILIVITVIGNVVASLALPAYLSTIINTSIPNKDIGQIVSIGGTMLNFVLLGAVCSIATGYFASKISMGIGKNMRSNVFKKIQYFSQTEFDRFSTSSLITRTNNDIIQVQNFVNMMLRISLMAPFMFVGGIIMALNKSATMSMILLISMPIMIVTVLVIGKFATPLSKKMQEKIDKINLVTREKLTGIRVARAFGTEDYETERFRKVNLDFMNNSIKMNTLMGTMTPVLSLILYATNVALLAFGGFQIINTINGIMIGDVIAVIQYVMQIMMSVMLLSMIFVMYPRAAVSAERINEVMDTLEVIQNPKEPVKMPKEKGYLEFKDVSFKFPGADHSVLKNISFKSSPGEITAIIGSTGSGKSVLVNLVPRFYDVNEGEILVDGVNVKNYDIKALRAKIGYVPQKAFLFKGTISDNIQFGDEKANDSRIEEAIRIAQSYDFVTAKEGGFEAPIAQGGSNVSGGQKQRLAIARAIVRKPEIYIFDDSFSALDFKTDAALREALMKEAQDATVLLVAQRVSTIMHADRILVMENGACVGMGSHSELLKTCKVYQEIVYSQLNKEEA